MAMDVLNLVIIQVPCIDTIEPFDIRVTFLLEDVPVERSDFLEIESIRLCIMKSFPDSCRIPCDFFRHAADINTCSSQSFRFNCDNLSSVHSTCSSSTCK